MKQNPSLYFSLVLFIIFNISIQIFMPYLILYYEVSLKMANYVFIMAPAIILAAIVTAFWGKVYDKKGFSFSSVFSVPLCSEEFAFCRSVKGSLHPSRRYEGDCP